MRTCKRIVSGTVALALLAATSMVVMPASAQAATPIERFDAMGLTPMPEEMASAQRGEALYVPFSVYKIISSFLTPAGFVKRYAVDYLNGLAEKYGWAFRFDPFTAIKTY